MWLFDYVHKLKKKDEQRVGEIKHLKEENTRLASLVLSRTDKEELTFLRNIIKDYVSYSYRTTNSQGWCRGYSYVSDRTLKDAESDLTRAKFYISVLESQLGSDKTESARNICKHLTDLCKCRESSVLELQGNQNL